MSIEGVVENKVKKPLKLKVAEGVGKNMAYGALFSSMLNLKKIEKDMPASGKLGSEGIGPVGQALLTLLTIPASLAMFEGYKALKNHLYPNVDQGFANMMEAVPELKDEIDTKEAYRRYAAFHALSPSLASHPMVAASFIKATAAGGGIDPGFAQTLLERTDMSGSEPIGRILSNALSSMPKDIVAYSRNPASPTGNANIKSATRSLAAMERQLKRFAKTPRKSLLENQKVSEVGRLRNRSGNVIVSRISKIKKLLGVK